MLAYAGSVPLGYHVPPVAVVDPHPIASDKDGSRAGAVTPRGGVAGAAAKAAPDPDSASGAKAVPALSDPYALTGPTPAFDANVLDAERDLGAVLARMNVARAQAEMAGITGATPGGQPVAVRQGAAPEAAEGRPPGHPQPPRDFGKASAEGRGLP